MRSSKSRSRGNKNRPNRPTGGNIINRVFDSSGPDGKVRGTPQQIIEKYTQLHRDAQLSGDRVNAENFAQHAEHYTRMLAEATREVDRAREEQEQLARDRQSERDRDRQQRHRMPDDAPGEPALHAQPDASPLDNPLYADQPDVDPGLVDTPEQTPRPSDRRDRNDPRGDRQGGDRQGGDRPVGDRQGGDRQSGDRPGADRQGNDRQGNDRAPQRPDSQPRQDRRDRRDRPERRDERPAERASSETPAPMIAPANAPATAPGPEVAPGLPAFLTSVTFAPPAPQPAEPAQPAPAQPAPPAASGPTPQGEDAAIKAPRARRPRKPKDTAENPADSPADRAAGTPEAAE